jgi:hypothetical protein
VITSCADYAPDYIKGARVDNELAKAATATCVRQNEAALEEYRAAVAEYETIVLAYNDAMAQRTMLMNQAFVLVNDAEVYVRRQQPLSNAAEQSRKVLTLGLVAKAFAILFF